MVEKSCCRSQGHPVLGVRRAAMISSRRAMSREGFMEPDPTKDGVRARQMAKGAPQEWSALGRLSRPQSVAVVAGAAGRLEQEPGPLPGLIKPDIDHAGGGRVGATNSSLVSSMV